MSSLARTRSLRLPPSATTATTTPTATTAATNNGTSAVASSSTGGASKNTSHLSLFLTNLRLLDLDRADDWPEITHLTFSTRDGAGGQKKRIQATEWALYHLFQLWDPEETQNKIRPFYPPLDQVRSINLRAALLRALEQAKRHGVLGRDAVVRKTMLDECRGERFEEVLAVFSSAVLKKMVAERTLNAGAEYPPTISEKIALENWGYSGERAELNALLLAHKASLRSLLASKAAARERYHGFEGLLASKEQGHARRREQVQSLDASKDAEEVPAKAKAEVRRTLQTNWTGNDQWAESLLYGDKSLRNRGFLATPFDQIWQGVQQGKLSDIEDQSTGLLEQLDQRITSQRVRLEKWDGYRKKFFGERPPEPEKHAEAPKGVDLGFTAHLSLRSSKTQVEDIAKLPLPAAPPEYAEILENMKVEIEETGRSRIPDFSQLVRGRGDNADEPVSDLSELEDELEEKLPPKPVAPSRNSRLRSPKRRTVINRQPEASLREEDDAPARKAQPALRQNTMLPAHPAAAPQEDEPQKVDLPAPEDHHDSPPASPALSASPEMPDRPLRSKKEVVGSLEPSPPRAISPTQAAADQILASISNASPSPAKRFRHTLSLAERTRMSMTRNHTFEPEEDDFDPAFLSPTPAVKPRPAQEAANQDDMMGEEHEDLVTRTRRSMAGFAAAQQKAQLDRRRSERKSKALSPRKDGYFPKVEENDVEGASMLEELLDKGEAEIDMDTVFRSRPRMRTSPAPSPMRRWDADIRRAED